MRTVKRRFTHTHRYLCNNNNDNNSHISIALYGRNFRGAREACFRGGGASHAIAYCTNASRSLSAIAVFLVIRSRSNDNQPLCSVISVMVFQFLFLFQLVICIKFA